MLLRPQAGGQGGRPGPGPSESGGEARAGSGGDPGGRPGCVHLEILPATAGELRCWRNSASRSLRNAKGGNLVEMLEKLRLAEFLDARRTLGSARLRQAVRSCRRDKVSLPRGRRRWNRQAVWPTVSTVVDRAPRRHSSGGGTCHSSGSSVTAASQRRVPERRAPREVW